MVAGHVDTRKEEIRQLVTGNGPIIGPHPPLYYIPPGEYHIKNAASGTAFDMAWEQETNRPIHGWEAHTGTNQQWLVDTADRITSFFLKSLNSDQYARVSAGVAGRPLHGSTHPMQWTSEGVWNEFTLVDPTSGLVAELVDGNPANGTPIQLKEKDVNKKAQRWVFEAC